MDHRGVDERLAGFWQGLVVLAQSAKLAQPGEGSFDYPAMRYHHEALDIVRALDDLENPVAELLDPVDKLSSIASISPNELESGKSALELADDQPCAVTVLDAGGMHDHREDQT